jgi:hypothetical protein
MRTSALDAKPACRALARLVESGLVERGDDGTHLLLAQAFTLAARASVSASDAGEDDDGDRETAKVLRAFVRDGHLTSIPAARTKRLVILDVLAQEFEPGRRYSERMVNLMLGKWHPDTAALRRYLVDEGFLDRANGEYWRTGGSVTT